MFRAVFPRSTGLVLLCGLGMLAAAIVTYLYLPQLAQNSFEQKFILQPDSVTFPSWKESKLKIYSYFYLFNITNSEKLLKADQVKPIVEEIGPYIFIQSYEKFNISFSEDKDTVSYNQVKRWHFVPELNTLSLDDEIVNINVPLISAVHQIKRNSNTTHDMMFGMELINSLKDDGIIELEVFRKAKVRELLFEGYADELLANLKFFAPDENIDHRFGWLHTRNGTSNDGNLRVFTGHSNFNKLGYVAGWNGHNTNTVWKEGSNCQSFSGTTTGDLLPPFYLHQNVPLFKYNSQMSFSQQPTTLRLFFPDMCRAFEMELQKPIEYSGIDAYRYCLGPDTFNYTGEANRCYCDKSDCPKDGLYNMGKCTRGSPIFVSHPHFLHGDPSLLDQVQGLRPNVEKHQFVMDYDQKTAITINVRARFQLNVLVEKSEHVDLMEDWPDDLNLYLPQIWFETRANLDQSMIDQILFMQKSVPLILMAVAICLAVVALAALSYVITFVVVNLLLYQEDQIEKYESVSMLESTNYN